MVDADVETILDDESNSANAKQSLRSVVGPGYVNVADRGDQASGERIGRFFDLRRALSVAFGVVRFS